MLWVIEFYICNKQDHILNFITSYFVLGTEAEVIQKKKQSLCRADENHKFEEMQASGRTESKMSRTNKKNRLLDK